MFIYHENKRDVLPGQLKNLKQYELISFHVRHYQRLAILTSLFKRSLIVNWRLYLNKP